MTYNTLFEMPVEPAAEPDDIAAALDLYREQRQAERPESVAKDFVYNRYPSLMDKTKFGTSEAGRWGKGIQDIERSLNSNGSGEFVAPDSPFSSAADFTRWMFVRWRDRFHPKAGYKFVFSPHQWADIFEHQAGKRVYPGAFTNEFLSSQTSSQLQKAGWKFDTAGNYESYEVLIIEAPAPPKQTYTAEEVDRIVADAAAKAAAEAIRRFMTMPINEVAQR